jgi:hypothetical protein
VAKARHIELATRFEDLPNVGKAMASDFRRLGLAHPRELASRDPLELYERISRIDGVRHDPCVLDTFRAAVDFARGGAPRPWWEFTAMRKG